MRDNYEVRKGLVQEKSSAQGEVVRQNPKMKNEKDKDNSGVFFSTKAHRCC